jgi:hypothetical protein
MSYYGGSGRLIMGDYYRGDPGFLSGLFNVAKTALGFIPGVGPLLSAGAGAVGGAIERKAATSAAGAGLATVGRNLPAGFFKGATTKIGTAIKAHPTLTAIGAAGAAGVALGAGGEALKARLARGGGRRHRRMRVTNPKALRRAIRRTSGFAKLAMRTIHIIHPKKRGRFGGFKRARRKC